MRIGRLDQSQDGEGEGERERELSMKNFALPLKFKDESDSCCERNRKRWTLPSPHTLPNMSSLSSNTAAITTAAAVRRGGVGWWECLGCPHRFTISVAGLVCLALCHTNHKNAASISVRCCCCCFCLCCSYVYVIFYGSLAPQTSHNFARNSILQAAMLCEYPKGSEREREGWGIGSWPRQQALLTYLVAFDLHIIKAAKISKYAMQLELWPRLTTSKEWGIR